MTILINNCEESSYSLEALLRNCFYQDASGNIYLGVKLGSTPPDGSPSNLIALGVAIDQINLSWTNGSTDEDGLSVERSTDGISYAEIDTVAAGVSTYNDTGLSTNTLYYYRVRAFKGALYSDYSNVDSTPTWSTQYKAVNDEFASAPSNADADAQNTFIKAGVDDGWLADLDALFVFASHASGADSLLNWIDPTGTSASLVNSPTFTLKQGYSGDTNKYINSNQQLNLLTQYAQDDASVGVYVRVAGSTGNPLGCGGSSKFTSMELADGGNVAYIINNNASDTYSPGTAGTWSIEKPATNDNILYKDGANIDSYTRASSGVPLLDLYFLAFNNNGSPTAYHLGGQEALGWAGKSLGATKELSLRTAFQALMTYYGTQI